MVSGCSTGRTMSDPDSKALAMGAQPLAWPPKKRTSCLVEQADLDELAEAALRAWCTSNPRPAARRAHRGAPAQLLGDLEGDGLGAFGVERAQVDVEHGPALELVGQLQAQAIDVVIGTVDAHDGGAERSSLGDLGRLEVGRDEDDSAQAVGSGGRGHGR